MGCCPAFRDTPSSRVLLRYRDIHPDTLFLLSQEWPVCLLRWKDKNSRGKARVLEVVDEFRSFVRPTWRPQLSPFCTTLTGITQVSTVGLVCAV